MKTSVATEPGSTARRFEPVWPFPELEKQMLQDAGWQELSHHSFARDTACHIKALLARVRELESKLPWLLRCEEAMRSMAAQFLCPKTTAEEMVEDILK
jgi:hypothetical protein